MSLVAVTVWDWLSQTPVDDRAPTMFVFGLFAVVLIIVVAVTVSRTICRLQKSRLEDSLKRELVDRGFSAEEIERIVRAEPGGTAKRGGA